MDNRLRGIVIGGWMGVLFWFAAGCTQTKPEDDYLIKVGDTKVMVAEYQHAFEMACEEAFPGEDEIEINLLNDLRMRVMNQLVEELIIGQRAKILGLRVSEEELEESVASIKADYPDDTFESTLLENAVSWAEWKHKLATRILIEKVIEKELVDKVQITSDDVATYFSTHFPNGAPEDADGIRRRIITHLRRQKAEEEYKGWMEGLRHAYPAEIHQERWNHLINGAHPVSGVKGRRKIEMEQTNGIPIKGRSDSAN